MEAFSQDKLKRSRLKMVKIEQYVFFTLDHILELNSQI